MNQPAANSRVRRTALRRLGRIAGAAALVLGLGSAVVAQETASPRGAGGGGPETADANADPPAVPPHVAEHAGRIQYVGPDTYILLDAQGRPQPVPGMTYEDFLAAWKEAKLPESSDRKRRYSIESIDVDGEARDGHARLKFTAKIKLLTDEPVDVPLGLLGSILQGEPEFGPGGAAGADSTSASASSGRGRHASRQEYLDFNPQRGGFIAQLEGRSGEQRHVSLHLIVPLTRDGTETTLPLNCPRAVSSSLSLGIDQPVTNVIVSSGTLLSTETVAGGTKLKIAGAMGAVRLTWQAGDAAGGEVATVLGAAGAVRVSIDGRSVRCDARLTVQSYGGSFDRFRVRLPAGAQLVRDERSVAETGGPRYRIAVEGQSPAATEPGDGAVQGQVVLVQLPEKQQSPASIELSTEQPIGLEDGGPVVELGGFEVLDAVRQYGDVAVEVAGDWQARWDVGDYVRQVDPSELDESLQQTGLTAAFQYDRQPWSLGVRITAREFRVHATPRYELEILPDEARLTAHLSYQVFGTRAFEFRVGLDGWELTEDAIESGGLVDQDRIQVAPDDTLVFPLAQSSSRRAEITFTLRRALERDRKRVRLPLPVPLADSLGTGELVITGAAEVELLPDLAASTGLTPTPVTEAVDAASDDHTTRHRFRTSIPKAVFVADRVSRTREVTAKAAVQVDIQPDEAHVDQRFDFVVRYEPIKELHFEIPSEFSFNPDQTEVVLLSNAGRGQEVRETPLSFMPTENDTEGLAPAARQLRVALPQPRLGNFVVRIRYQVPSPYDDWDGDWSLPLFEPVDGNITDQIATVRTPRTLAVALDTVAPASTWKQAEPTSDAAGDGAAHQYVAERSESALPLLLRAVDPNLPSSTIVERVWLQTWLSGDARQDRVAFRFRTTASQTTIELPPQVPPDEVEVLVDGRPAELLSRGSGRILVRPPQSPAGQDQIAVPEAELHTLELRYRQPARPGLVRRHRLTPPQIVGTTALSEVYWQIVLPGDQHIIRSPARMTCAGRWQWLGSFWGRRPIMSQANLEKWSGASSQLGPAAADSQHLFTGLAPVSTIEVITAPRWLIVLAASSAVLVVLLLWVYLPRTQRGRLLVGGAVVIAALAAAFPAPALLLAQAAAVGVVVAAISVLIARAAARPARWPVTISSGSSQRQSMSRGDSRLMSPVAAASTAPTSPLAIPESER